MENKIEKEIDLIKLFSLLWDKKYLIGSITFIFTFFSILYALWLPNIYSSKSVLHPVIDDATEVNALSSMASKYGGLAAATGISLPQNVGVSKTAVMIATINSREFFSHLLTFDNIKLILFATKAYNPETKAIEYDPKIYNPETKNWIEGEPTDLEVYKMYGKILSLNEDKVSGLITISIDHQSPIFAKDFLELIIYEINDIMRNRDIVESTESLEFLTSQLSKTPQSDIKFSINQLIETQLKKQMLTKVRKYYILNPIDAPFIPEEKSEPKRSEIVILFTILGLIFSIIIVMYRNYKKIINKT
jgi:uncharacterized protein involved in exopolysaccharide biosynthesis